MSPTLPAPVAQAASVPEAQQPDTQLVTTADGAPGQQQKDVLLAGLHQGPQQEQQQQPPEQPLPPDQGLLRLLRPLKGTMHVPEEVYAREPVVTAPKLTAELLPAKDLGTLRGGRCVRSPTPLVHRQVPYKSHVMARGLCLVQWAR